MPSPHHVVTPEDAWRSWARNVGLPIPDWGTPGKAVVVAPSYVDPVVAAGGTLCRLEALGWHLTILVVTGRADRVSDSLLVAGQVELVGEADGSRALRRLGLARAPVCHLHLPAAGPVPDPDHLVRLLAYELVGCRWCIAPFPGEADAARATVGAAASRAARGAGAAVAAYPVDVWSWAEPGGDDLPWARAAAQPLDDVTLGRKADAVSELSTAAVAVGEAPLAGPAARSWELFFVE
ncbi:MAG TPA: hypothetical protein VF640_01380 [Acidimicrobiales bacterium]|jgi:hypothetical protein